MAVLFLTAERLAIADQVILSTFEQSSVVWRTIPHWDTGDPGLTRVRGDVSYSFSWSEEQKLSGPMASAPFSVGPLDVPFRATLAQVTSATPDQLLAAVISRTVELAQKFDTDVLTELAGAKAPAASQWIGLRDDTPASEQAAQDVLTSLTEGRYVLEDAGFRAPSCLIANGAHVKVLNQWIYAGLTATEVLSAASIAELYRTSVLRKLKRSILLGRRRDLPAGRAAEASPGEEPVDIAVCVPPSLEIVGDDGKGGVDLGLRMRYATRIKDERGVVVFDPSAPEPDETTDEQPADVEKV
jgi:hypothetical protein